MNQLVFIVEDDHNTAKILSVLLRTKDINFIIASDLPAAIELFERNKELITFTALDGNLEHSDHSSDEPETRVLARIIADSQSYKGVTFAMSLIPAHCVILQKEIGERCEIFDSGGSGAIKFETIKEIVRRIAKSRKKGEGTH